MTEAGEEHRHCGIVSRGRGRKPPRRNFLARGRARTRRITGGTANEGDNRPLASSLARLRYLSMHPRQTSRLSAAGPTRSRSCIAVACTWRQTSAR